VSIGRQSFAAQGKPKALGETMLIHPTLSQTINSAVGGVRLS